jgi:hypothetical protein
MEWKVCVVRPTKWWGDANNTLRNALRNGERNEETKRLLEDASEEKWAGDDPPKLQKCWWILVCLLELNNCV